jgi:hypothetical protein
MDSLGKCAAAALLGAVASFATPAMAGDTLKDQIAGAWKLVSIHNVRADGSKYELFGPSAKGTLVLGRDGHYSLQIMRATRPPFVARSRLEGTAEENKAAVQGMISHFGTYTVDEPSRTLTFRIEGSSYPNWDGARQTRSFTLLKDRLAWTDVAAGPAPGDLQSDLVWQRATVEEAQLN